MSKTRAELRVLLAQQAQRYFTGTATGGSTTTIIDTAGLEKWADTDALKGAYAFISAAGGAAPEGESARIQSFNATTNTITLDTALSAAVASGDTYELYLAPLDLGSWNHCVNEAIRQAWPELYISTVYESFSKQSTVLSVPSSSGIEAVTSIFTVYGTCYDGTPAQVLPRASYTVTGEPGAGLTVYLHRPPPATYIKIRVAGKKRYAELATESASTNLDPAYLLAAARANWYELMANASRGQADQSAYLQLMNHWQQKADEAKRMLALLLEGAYLPPEVKRK